MVVGTNDLFDVQIDNMLVRKNSNEPAQEHFGIVLVRRSCIVFKAHGFNVIIHFPPNFKLAVKPILSARLWEGKVFFVRPVFDECATNGDLEFIAPKARPACITPLPVIGHKVSVYDKQRCSRRDYHRRSIVGVTDSYCS